MNAPAQPTTNWALFGAIATLLGFVLDVLELYSMLGPDTGNPLTALPIGANLFRETGTIFRLFLFHIIFLGGLGILLARHAITGYNQGRISTRLEYVVFIRRLGTNVFWGIITLGFTYQAWGLYPPILNTVISAVVMLFCAFAFTYFQYFLPDKIWEAITNEELPGPP